MLPTVAVANDGGRALLLLTLASAARAGLEDPCKYTPDGFERPRPPCGMNGLCSWNELAPNQRAFNCTCIGNYIGDRCERCDHGYTFKSGCEEKAREHDSTAFVVWASIIGATLMVGSIMALAFAFHKKVTEDPGILFSKMVEAGDDQIVLMRSASSMLAPRRARKQDVCYYCKQPGHWKTKCPVLAEHVAAGGEAANTPFATAADWEAAHRKGKKLQP